LQQDYTSAAYANYAANIKADDLPPDIRSVLKSLLLDSIGTAIAATSRGEGCKEVIALASQGASVGGPQATVPLWGYPIRTTPLAAALANGALVHALNFDAVGAGHAGLIVPAALAAAEAQPKVSGNEILAALAAGGELLARLETAAGEHGRKALDGQLHGYFGCAAAAARVLRLSPERFHDAICLALMQAAGSMQVVLDGDPPAKAIYGAFPNQAGLQAALLASHGLKAGCNAFDGEAGLFQLFYSRDSRIEIAAELGVRHEIRRLRFKRWPTSAHLHPLIEAAASLKNNPAVDIGHLESVAIVACAKHRAWFEPPELRCHPENAAAAANSGQFVVAKVLLNGSIGLDDFTSAGLRQPDARNLASRIVITFEDGVQETIRLTDSNGRCFCATAAASSAQMETQAVHDKFRACIAYAANDALPGKADAIIAAVSRLEHLDDIRDLTHLLC
jgi:2-methylcitrate dehydratase PrpD